MPKRNPSGEQYSVTTELQHQQSNQPINCRLLKPVSINTAKTKPKLANTHTRASTYGQIGTQIQMHSHRITNLKRTINAITRVCEWEGRREWAGRGEGGPQAKITWAKRKSKGRAPRIYAISAQQLTIRWASSINQQSIHMANMIEVNCEKNSIFDKWKGAGEMPVGAILSWAHFQSAVDYLHQKLCVVFDRDCQN